MPRNAAALRRHAAAEAIREEDADCAAALAAQPPRTGAQEAFNTASVEFRDLLAMLQAARNAVGSAGRRNWGDVGTLNAVNQQLRDAVRFLESAAQ